MYPLGVHVQISFGECVGWGARGGFGLFVVSYLNRSHRTGFFGSWSVKAGLSVKGWLVLASPRSKACSGSKAGL